MTSKKAILEVSSGHARITLNRPERLNALTKELLIDLRSVVDEAIARDDVRVITLTGHGKGFCAGQDLSERDPRKLNGPLDLEAIQIELFHPILLALAKTQKPIIAAVNGVAAGAGIGFALAADVIVATSSANFVFSFSKVGLSVDAGLGQALAKAVGANRAKAILMLGDTLSSDRAAALGLIWKTFPDNVFATAADDIACKLAATPRLSLAGIKGAIAASELPQPDYLRREASLQGAAGFHPDYAEGVLAFLEKRAPDFS